MKVTRKQLRKFIKESINQSHKHQRSREPGVDNTAGVTLPTPGPLDPEKVYIPPGFYRDLLRMYDNVGMHDEAAKLRRKLELMSSKVRPEGNT